MQMEFLGTFVIGQNFCIRSRPVRRYWFVCEVLGGKRKLLVRGMDLVERAEMQPGVHRSLADLQTNGCLSVAGALHRTQPG